jgi:uncharacterized protein YeeX (DUF496 family)
MKIRDTRSRILLPSDLEEHAQNETRAQEIGANEQQINSDLPEDVDAVS